MNALPHQFHPEAGPLPTVTAKEPKTIGVIFRTSGGAAFYDGFKAQLAELGHVEGVDVIYDFDPAMLNLPRETRDEDIEEFARDYVRKGYDLIYSVRGGRGIEAALAEMESLGVVIPIVFSDLKNPPDEDYVDSFESSGSNVAGVAKGEARTELESRRLGFLKQINPDAKTIGMFTDGFANPKSAGLKEIFPKIKELAPQFGLTVVEYTTDFVSDDPDAWIAEFQRVADSIKVGDIDALPHGPGHSVKFQEQYEAELTIRLGIPYLLASLTDETYLESLGLGGTYAYFEDRGDIGRKAGVIASKILNGTAPSDIPIESPSKNTLFINLEMAARQGIVIPESMLSIADEIKE